MHTKNLATLKEFRNICLFGQQIMREFNVLEITIFSSKGRFVYSGRKQIGRKFNVLDFIIIESEELGVRNLTKQ